MRLRFFTQSTQKKVLVDYVSQLKPFQLPVLVKFLSQARPEGYTAMPSIGNTFHVFQQTIYLSKSQSVYSLVTACSLPGRTHPLWDCWWHVRNSLCCAQPMDVILTRCDSPCQRRYLHDTEARGRLGVPDRIICLCLLTFALIRLFACLCVLNPPESTTMAGHHFIRPIYKRLVCMIVSFPSDVFGVCANDIALPDLPLQCEF